MKVKSFFTDLKEGIVSIFKGKSHKDNLFNLNGRVPLKSAIPFGIQHVLAMFAANVTPIIIVFSVLGLYGTNFAIYSMLGALFMAGIGTMIQLFIGARLPIVIGTSFTFVPIFITIGLSAGGGEAAYYTIMGSIIVGGLFAAIFSLLYRFWGKIIKPIVPAIVVLGIGLSLLSSGANQFFGGTTIISNIIETGNTGTGVNYIFYLLVAFITIVVALLWSLLIKGVWKNINIVVGIIVGYIVACVIPGMVDFSILKIDTANLIGPNGIFDFPHLLDFTKLRFELVPCILTCVCFIVAIVEAIGDTTALANSGLNRNPTNRELGGTLFFDGLNSTIGACFGALPLTTFSQNVGIIAQTKVVNRFTIFIGSLFLVVASFFPPIANFIYSIPDVVIGGTMVILFGSIAVVGMKSISELGWSDKNIMITAISVCLGFGITIANVSTSSGSIYLSTSLFSSLGIGWLGDLLSNNVLNMFVISIILSWVLPDNMHINLFRKKKENIE
ncbi:MAG: uracil-xanthine permease family protein [Bacilli bacterium]